MILSRSSAFNHTSNDQTILLHHTMFQTTLLGICKVSSLQHLRAPAVTEPFDSRPQRFKTDLTMGPGSCGKLSSFNVPKRQWRTQREQQGNKVCPLINQIKRSNLCTCLLHHSSPSYLCTCLLHHSCLSSNIK